MSLTDLNLNEFDRLTREANAIAAEAERTGTITPGTLKRITQNYSDANECLKAAKAERDSQAAVRLPDGMSRKSVDPAWRDFMTPGSLTKEYWISPAAEQTVGRLSRLTTKAYLTSDTGGGTSGAGYWFTDEQYRDVLMGLQAASGVLEADPTFVVTNHLRDIQVPVLTADATATVGVEGSDGTAAETDGTVATLGHYRYDGVFSVSGETILSAEYAVDELMSTYASRSIANIVAAKLAMGVAATPEPSGVFTSSTTTGVTAASQTAVTADEVLDLTKSVGKGFRKGAKLVMSDVLHTSLLKLKDDTDGYLLRSLDGGGYQFAGYPVFVEPQADQSGLSAGEIHAVFGDFNSYFVRMTPMLFHKDESNPLVVKYRFGIWLDAKVGVAAGLRNLKLAA